MYRSRRLYELCFRATEGLPLPARPLANFLIKAALARTQRDEKVQVCNYLWMPNHPHLSFISKDVNALRDFYGELKKKLTDMLKRLLGETHLNIWPKQPTVIEILDLEKAIDRHAYYFLNPARAALVPTIDEYTGESTWKAFLSAEAAIDTKIEVEVPWVRLPSIPELSRPNPSKAEELRVIAKLSDANSDKEKLIYYPFAWMKVFGISKSEEVEAVRMRVVKRVREVERELVLERAKAEKGTVGASRLVQEGFLLSGYLPKKNDRSIFFLTSLSELRRDILATFKEFCVRCSECFIQACAGVKEIVWPHGAFVPPLPPLVNPI